MTIARYVSLHNHTQFSLLDGMADIATPRDHPERVGYVEQAVRFGMPALGITDHGNLCGAPEFYHACRKAGIEPVLGEEFYFTHDVKERIKRGEKQAEKFHFVMLARGEAGYRVLTELTTEANRHFYGKPILDWDIVERLGDDAKHVTVLSGCANSVISHAVLDGNMEEAQQFLLRWREMTPNFYMELQHHGTDFDRRLNAGLLKLARKYKVPHVVTNDPHYVLKEECEQHDALLAIQTASNLEDEERFRFDGTGYHLRTQAEMRKAFLQYGRHVMATGVRNTMEVAKDCYTRIPAWEKRTWQIPTFPHLPEDTSPYSYIRKLAKKAMKDRGFSGNQEYEDRLEHELKVIKQAEVSGFLLITMDMVDFAERRTKVHRKIAKELNHAPEAIRVGPGRGSVCGCLVAYLLGIHKIDPVKYDLLFERFLNVERPRMPDIDTDFQQSRRDEMFEYAIYLYGDDNVIKVAAYQHMQFKAAFQQLARAFGMEWNERLRYSKELSDEDDAELPAELTTKYPEMDSLLRRLVGIKRAISNHPAGIIITAPEHELKKQVPEMFIASSKKWVGGYDLETVEEIGLMKQDFLGLRNLDTIEWTVRFIKKLRGIDVEPDDWVPDTHPLDKKVYRSLHKKNTVGVFQMEGPTNARGIREIVPTCFEDIVSCTSLYRTGAISAGFPEVFLKNRRQGTIDYVHPSLEPILGHTWGVVLYQEQVMEMGATLAGFSMVEVDDIKEAIKHKKSTLMEEMKPRFIQGCMDVQGMSEVQAAECWRYIEGYAGYGYNRSHAVAYTMTTYQTARLRELYPQEFWAAALRTVDQSNEGGKEKRDTFGREAISCGFTIVKPDLNEADSSAVALPGGRIMFGLCDLAGIGEKAAERILGAREGLPEGRFTEIEQVQACTNKKTFEVLEQSGCLEFLDFPGKPGADAELLRWDFTDPMIEFRNLYSSDVVWPEDRDQPDEEVILVGRIYSVTRKISKKTGKPFLTWKCRWDNATTFDVRLWSTTQKLTSAKNLWALHVGSVIMVQGEWETDWKNVSVGDSRQVQVLKAVYGAKQKTSDQS